jgi:hypothetical protein
MKFTVMQNIEKNKNDIEKKNLGQMEFKSFPCLNKFIKVGNKNFKIISILLKGREKVLNVK